MAENQVTARPRDSGGFGHLFRRCQNIWPALVVLCAAAMLPDAASAQDIGLQRGEASLNAGQFKDAARQLTATVNDKDATINQVSKALYLRGIAYRREGYPGQAISDLGAALWLGLPSSDKARAYVNKGLAFQAAGMESQGASAMAQARRYSSASTVQKLIAQDGGVAPVASGGIASYIPSVPSVPSPGEVWEKVVPTFGAPKTAAQPAGEAAAPAENTSVWDKIVPSFGSSKTAAPAAESAGAAASAAAEPKAAPTSGWDASVSEGSGGNAVSRWWGSVAGGGAPAAQTAPAASAPSPPAANTTTATRSSTASSAAAQPQAAPSTGWDTSVSEGEGGSPVKHWWNSVTGNSQ